MPFYTILLVYHIVHLKQIAYFNCTGEQVSPAQFIFYNHRMTKSTRPKIDKCSIKMVNHCILQVHYILSMLSSCLVTAPISFICCKTRLITNVLSFMCLHNMYITKVITNNEILTVMNRKHP